MRVSIVFLLVLLTAGSQLREQALGQSAAPTPVAVVNVLELEVHSGYRVVGTVAPLRTSTIGAAVGGRVDAFLVDVGLPVKAGDPIAQLKIETLNIELRAAEAELELYHQQLLELENGSLPEEVAEAEARASGARAAMENAANHLRRLEALSSSRAATDADLEDARERANMTRFNYAAEQAALQRIQLGPRKEQIAQRQAQENLQKQNVLLIKDRIAKHTIVAPFDGFVAAEFTEIGAWINSGDPVAQVIQLDQVEIEAPVTADFVTKLKLGDIIRVEFPQLPGKLLTGKIDRIVPMADSRARTFPLFIRLENEFRDSVPLVMAGMLARVDLPAGVEKVLPLVPKDALVLSDRDCAVFIVDMDKNASTGTVRKVDVDLGVAKDKLIQVSGDLQAGQKVVVVGNERLSPGMKVTVLPSPKKTQPEG